MERARRRGIRRGMPAGRRRTSESAARAVRAAASRALLRRTRHGTLTILEGDGGCTSVRSACRRRAGRVVHRPRPALLPLAAARLARRRRGLHRGAGSTATTWPSWRGWRRSTCRRSIAGDAAARPLVALPQAAARWRERNTPRRARRADRRPLRPRQRPLQADARRDDDVLVRDLRRAGELAARGAARRSSTASAASSTCGRSDHVLEIGTGWGGFAIHAASHYGCRVTTTTISAEQHALAIERVRAAGLEDRVTRAAARTTATSRAVRQARLDRDDRGGRLAVLRHLLRALRLAAEPRRARCCCRRSRSTSAPTTSRRPSGASPTRTSSRVAACRRCAVISRSVARVTDLRPVAPRGHHRALRAHAALLARELRSPSSSACARSATTGASSACGSSTSPTARAASAAGGSATCSCCSPSRNTARRPSLEPE